MTGLRENVLSFLLVLSVAALLLVAQKILCLSFSPVEHRGRHRRVGTRCLGTELLDTRGGVAVVVAVAVAVAVAGGLWELSRARRPKKR